MQRFERTEDFEPPKMANRELSVEWIKILLAHEGEPVPERDYVTTFLGAINKGLISTTELSILMFGCRVEYPEKLFRLHADLLKHYRDLLSAVVDTPNLVNPLVYMDLALQLRGKIIKIPVPGLSRDGFKMTDRVGAVDQYSALAYSNLLLLSNFKDDLCKCGLASCKTPFFLAESDTKGRTRRAYCSTAHRKKAVASTATLRAEASRAGIEFRKWEKIKAEDPAMTPGKYEVRQMQRARKHK
jgi:hypothetical protein